MADIRRRLSANMGDDFFVDDTCIDCDACRQLAPETFREHEDQSIVHHQPQTLDEIKRAMMALVTCPTASIGTAQRHNPRIGIDAFPARISENIYFCGFASESSFGAWSYLILRSEAEGGNLLVDSPRFAGQLVRRIESLGGLRTIFLTHRDDVADHEKFAQKFSTHRIMHADDGASRFHVEQIIEGNEAFNLDRDITIIPTPGHTRGHSVLLYRNKFLFTGDHLAWSPARETLTAFRSACWYSWTEQIRSMEKLLDYDFEWVLPGHGRIHHASREGMRAHLTRCIEWMKERR